MQKSALVCGAGGFIGGHLVKRLKREGFWVRGVDLKFHEHAETEADDFVIGDLREQSVVHNVIDRRFDEVYQLAADMGGAADQLLFVDGQMVGKRRLVCQQLGQGARGGAVRQGLKMAFERRALICLQRQ